MKRPIIIPALYTLPCISLATKVNPSCSVNRTPLYQEKTRDTTVDDQAEHCKRQREQLDELEYRPLRRNAVVERFRIECEPDDAEPSPTDFQ